MLRCGDAASVVLRADAEQAYRVPMSRLVYSVACSLDGYNSDAGGGFDWAFPSEEVVSAINDDLSSISTFLYGRRMYETMSGWETEPAWADTPEMARFAEIWQRAEKVVYSRTLDDVVTTRTRLERELTAESIERALASATGDVTIEGPALAATAFRLGLIDVVQLLICPAIVGGGIRALPDDVRLDLRLVRERRFENGMVQVTYERA